ncbi:MAG: LPS export ABC transporter ATP-binding protein [Acidobacteriota bacterium]|jgi:lipopolysaccharide export system ATP-binding protein|nr:LPS export ABC transporter ATP-binding protein [Acidobacteriota bacterium]
MKILEGIHISKSFKGRRVVKEVDLCVRAGEIIGLLGPNGAGKTTTFRLMLGMLNPESGSIRLNGDDITRLPVYCRARLGIGFLPQEPSVFRNMTVRENLLAVVEMHRHIDRGAIDRALDEMKLTALAHRRAALLSGGERRRLEIARALILTPDFLLLDEPFAGIDPLQITELQRLILELRERGMGIIITDHNVREILKITDRSYIINRGDVIFHGNSAALIHDQRVKSEYLGHDFRWN